MTSDKRRAKNFLGAVGSVWMALLLLAHPAVDAWGALGEPRLRLARGAISSTEVQFRVLLVSGVPVGAYTMEIRFDPEAMELVDVRGGVASQFISAPITNRQAFATGVVRFSAFQAQEVGQPTGKVHVATIVARPRGGNDKVKLRVQPVTVSDTSGNRFVVKRRAARASVVADPQ